MIAQDLPLCTEQLGKIIILKQLCEAHKTVIISINKMFPFTFIHSTFDRT